MKRALPIKNSRPKICAIFLGAAIGCVVFCSPAQVVSTSTNLTNLPSENSAELIEFLDGSILHGQLRSIDSGKGLKWEHPAAKQPIEFKPENIAAIRFPNVEELVETNAGSTCQFRLANGDEFYGDLLSLDENELELQTWFGGKLKTPRASMQSILFFQKGSATLYEGPTSLDGWQVGKTLVSPAWRYEDGALIAVLAGTIGRDLKLPDASRVEFDLTWNSPFNLLFSFYTSVFDGFNYNNSSYIFYITPGNISLQRINAATGPAMIGRSEIIQSLLSKKKAHLEFRGNKVESTLELLVDGKLISQWKDTAGWAGKGSGILFFAQNENAVKVSNIKASPWDGNPSFEIATNAPSGEDQIYLANRDKVSGKVANLHNGNLRFKSSVAPLEIPLQRVTQIIFGGTNTNAIPRSPWEIQASVFGGGKISFTLENWNNGKVLGQNKNFGKISLDSKSIRQLQFNLDQTRIAAGEINSVDDVIWEDDEQ